MWTPAVRKNYSHIALRTVNVGRGTKEGGTLVYREQRCEAT
jgi:hypothetical protein